MSRAQELLDAATPLPWPEDYGQAIGDDINDPDDAALAIYAVNALPAYEVAREALDRLERLIEPEFAHDSLVGLACGDARDALARLRDEVPSGV